MVSLKTLVFDIETAPMTAYVWGRRDVNISTGHIQRDWSIIAWSAKWLGQPASKIIYYDQRDAKNTEDDKAILKPLWKLLDEADIVITQNGKNFDSKMLNTRFIIHGWAPPSPYKHLDTYQIIRRVSKFTSNRLEYLAEKLCTKYKKSSHPEFPGMALWAACLAGNKAAWNAMKRYNIHDVLSTEELYQKIKQWVPESMPSTKHPCSRRYFKPDGYRVRYGGVYQYIFCMKCKVWFFGEEK